MATAPRAYSNLTPDQIKSEIAAGTSSTGFTRLYKHFWWKAPPKVTSSAQTFFVLGIIDETVSSKYDAEGKIRGRGNSNSGPEYSEHHPDSWWSEKLDVPLRTFQWLKADAIKRGLIQKMPGQKRGCGLRYKHTPELLETTTIPVPADFIEPREKPSQTTEPTVHTPINEGEETAKLSRNGLRLQHTFTAAENTEFDWVEAAPMLKVKLYNEDQSESQVDFFIDPNVTDATGLVVILQKAKQAAEQSKDTTDPHEADRDQIRSFFRNEAKLPVPSKAWIDGEVLKRIHKLGCSVDYALGLARTKIHKFKHAGFLLNLLDDEVANTWPVDRKRWEQDRQFAVQGERKAAAELEEMRARAKLELADPECDPDDRTLWLNIFPDLGGG